MNLLRRVMSWLLIPFYVVFRPPRMLGDQKGKAVHGATILKVKRTSDAVVVRVQLNNGRRGEIALSLTRADSQAATQWHLALAALGLPANRSSYGGTVPLANLKGLAGRKVHVIAAGVGVYEFAPAQLDMVRRRQFWANLKAIFTRRAA